MSDILDILYPPEVVREDWFVRLSLISESDEFKKTETQLVKLTELKKNVKKFVEFSKNNPCGAYYRPGIRDHAGKILGATAVWLDIDAQKHNLEFNKVKTELENLSVRPSLIIWSGRGFHVYWILSSFCSDISRLKRIAKGIADKLSKAIQKGIDQQILTSGPDAGARLVGSVNYKNGIPNPVSVLMMAKDENDEVVKYQLDELPEKVERGAKSTSSGQLIVRVPRDVYTHYFPDLDPTKDQVCVSCPFHEDNNPSLSIELKEGNWWCRSDSHTGLKQGGPISFYALMEDKSITEAKKDLKSISTSSDKDSLRDQLGAILNQTFLPLYRKSDMVYGIFKPTQELVQIDTTANENTFTTHLAYALGGSPMQIIEEHIPSDVLGMISPMSVFRDIVLNILVKLPKDKSFMVIGSGVHHAETNKGWKSFLVDGEDFYEAKKQKGGFAWEKQQLEGPAYDLIIPKFGLNNFYPFWDKKVHGVVPKPSQLWDELFPILNDSWSWTEPADPYLLSLYLCYVWYHHWFGRPIEVFLCGDSSSGKSCISEGLFAGTRDGSFGLIAGALTSKSTSEAGFYQEVSHQSKLLVLDELYDSKEPWAKKVMESLRNMDAKNYAVKRGTPGGKMVEYPIRVPVLWSAIKGPELEQDLNRKIMIYMRPKEGQRDPWDKIWSTYTETQLERIRAALPLFLLPYQDQLKEAKEKIIGSFMRSGKIPWRKGQMLLPLLQIASVIGLDTKHLADLLTERSTIEADQIAREKLDRELMSFLLDYKFTEGDSDITTSLAKRITSRSDLSEPNFGIYYRKRNHKIYLQGPQLVNNLLGKIPNFRDINTRSLSTLLRPRPFYEGSQTKYLGPDWGARHVTCIDVKKLLDVLGIDLSRDADMDELGRLS